LDRDRYRPPTAKDIISGTGYEERAARIDAALSERRDKFVSALQSPAEEASAEVAQQYVTFEPGPKLAALYAYFESSVKFGMGRTASILSDRAMLMDEVRDDLINQALGDQGPEIPDVSVWEYIEENQWIGELDELGTVCGPQGTLYGAAHDYLALALLLHFRVKYAEWLPNRLALYDEFVEGVDA